MKKEIKILDCTLRDGGYYNNWDFSLDLVSDYIKSISSSGIKYIELGFRSFPSKSFGVQIGILRKIILILAYTKKLENCSHGKCF